MSQQIIKQVDQAFPALLQQNIGSTCFRFLQIAKDRLERAGHTVRFIVKTNRDGGQYRPPGLGQHQIRGTDGNLYTLTGVSHDALYVDGEQRDVIGGAVYHDEPWFENGKQVIGRPTWGDPVPHHEWRPWNPPLPLEFEKLFAPVPPPTGEPPPTSVFEMPGYDRLGDDPYFVGKVGAFVAEEMGTPRCNNCGSHDIAGGMNAGSASWIARTVHSIIASFIKHKDLREADAIALKHRNEMRAVLQRPPLP